MSYKSLYIRNLHEDVTEEMLKQKFAVAGNVVSAKIHQNGQFVFAYVNFGDHIEAKHALKTMNGDEIKGVPMQLRYSKHDPALQNAKDANIIIKNLDKNILEKELKSVCSRYGTILSIKIQSDENGSKGYGYVNYENEEQAQHAILSLHQQTIGRKKVYVEKFKPRSERANNSIERASNVNFSQQRCSSENNLQSEAVDETDNQMNNQIDYNQRNPALQNAKDANIIIKNLDKHILEKELKSVCSRYGTILSIKIQSDEKGSKGYGYVNYENEEQAQHAILSLHQQTIGRKKVYVEKFKPRSERANNSIERASNVNFSQQRCSSENSLQSEAVDETNNQENVIEMASFQHVAIMPCEEKHAKLLHKEFSSKLVCRLSIVNEGLKFVGNKNDVLAEKNQLCKVPPMKASYSVSAPKLSSLFGEKSWKKTCHEIENTHLCLLAPVVKAKAMQKKQPAKKSLKYQVCQGNIADESSDAIVNGVSSDFNLEWGKVSPAILEKAGNDVQDECTTNPVISAPHLRVTKAGNLSCKYIFHMVTPNLSDELTKRIKTVLQNAETLGIKSISFPTLGAGGIGIDSLDVAMAMKKAFDEYFDENSSNSSIEAINVVVFKPSLVPVFQQHSIPRCAAFIEDGDSPSSMISSVFYDDEENYDIEITALYKNVIDLIKRELEKFMSQVIVEKELKENVSKLEEHDLIDIKNIGSDCSVSIKTVNNSGEKMVIRGFTKNVESASEKIEVIFKDLDVAMLVSKMSVWKREDPPGHFVRFPLRVSQILECNHENKVKSCNVNVCGRDILVDLEKRTYRRRFKSGAVIREANNLDLPDYWTYMNNSAMVKVELVSGSSEYNRVRDLFQKRLMGSSCLISKIERIQNPTLYRQYAVKKKDVEKHLQGSQPAERELFHGTKSEYVNKICVDGFDRGFAGMNAAAYGKGCYFALNSNYSVRFCDNSGMKHMFLASVLTGNYCQGSPSLVKPPPMGFAANIRHYDSVVDNPNSPTIFVVFKDSSVYPQYLITFQ